MSSLFQKMAYWGNSLMWYWIGAGLAYLLLGFGVLFLVLNFINRNKPDTIIGLGLSFISAICLLSSFLWTTFVIVAGMSGL